MTGRISTSRELVSDVIDGDTLIVGSKRTQFQIFFRRREGRTTSFYDVFIKNKCNRPIEIRDLHLFHNNLKQFLVSQSLLFSRTDQEVLAGTVEQPSKYCYITCRVEENYDPSTGLKLDSENPLAGKHDLCSDLLRLKLDSDTTDFTLVCGGQRLPCHKLVLAARSDVFAAMFQHTEMKEAREREVDLGPDVDGKTGEKFLEFVYTDRVKEIKGHAESLLALADKYNVAELKLLCEEAINLEVDNVVRMLQLAMRHRAKFLEHWALDLIVKHFEAVEKTQDWIDASTSLEFVYKIMKAMAARRSK